MLFSNLAGWLEMERSRIIRVDWIWPRVCRRSGALISDLLGAAIGDTLAAPESDFGRGPIASTYRRSINSWLYFVLGPATGFRCPATLKQAATQPQIHLQRSDTNVGGWRILKIVSKAQYEWAFRIFRNQLDCIFSTRCRRESNMSSVAKCLCPQLGWP